jgi:transcriptional regulator of acetoin/glycerol metabolism
MRGINPGLSMNIANFNSGAQTFTNLKKKWSDEFEKEYLENLLSRTQGNVTAAAKESGIDRSNFLRLLRRHQINAQNYRGNKDIKIAA